MSTLHQVMLVMLAMLCIITFMVGPPIVWSRESKVNTCRDAGYVDYIKWDGVAYCVRNGETSDELGGVKYEVVVE